LLNNKSAMQASLTTTDTQSKSRNAEFRLVSFVSIVRRLPDEMLMEIFKYTARSHVPPSLFNSVYFVKRWEAQHIRRGVTKYYSDEYHRDFDDDTIMVELRCPLNAPYMHIIDYEDDRETRYDEYRINDIQYNHIGLVTISPVRPKQLIRTVTNTYTGDDKYTTIINWQDDPDAVEKRRSMYSTLNGKYHGDYKTWDSKGQLDEHCFYDHGEAHGESKSWHPNDQPFEHCFYDHGKLHGEYKGWFSNGRLREHCFYDNGKRHGEYKSWQSSGQLQMHYFYNQGLTFKTTDS